MCPATSFRIRDRALCRIEVVIAGGLIRIETLARPSEYHELLWHSIDKLLELRLRVLPVLDVGVQLHLCSSLPRERHFHWLSRSANRLTLRLSGRRPRPHCGSSGLAFRTKKPAQDVNNSRRRQSFQLHHQIQWTVLRTGATPRDVVKISAGVNEAAVCRKHRVIFR